MTWLTLLIISIIAYSLGILLQRVLLKDKSSDPVAYSIVSSIVSGVLIGIYAIFKEVSLNGLTEVVPQLILMAILYGSAFYCMFTSLKLIEASEFSVLFATRALWSIIAAILFLHEQFSVQQIFGTVLIIISVLIVSLHPNTAKQFKFGRGQLLALLGAMVFGSSFINDAIILQKVDALAYSFLIFLIPNILLWLIFPKTTKTIRKIVKGQDLWKLVLLGVFSAVGAVTFFLSYQAGRNAAQIASINQVSIITIVFFAIIFLKERSGIWKKVVAAIISFIGVLLVK